MRFLACMTSGSFIPGDETHPKSTWFNLHVSQNIRSEFSVVLHLFCRVLHPKSLQLADVRTSKSIPRAPACCVLSVTLSTMRKQHRIDGAFHQAWSLRGRPPDDGRRDSARARHRFGNSPFDHKCKEAVCGFRFGQYRRFRGCIVGSEVVRTDGYGADFHASREARHGLPVSENHSKDSGTSPVFPVVEQGGMKRRNRLRDLLYAVRSVGRTIDPQEYVE